MTPFFSLNSMLFQKNGNFFFEFVTRSAPLHFDFYPTIVCAFFREFSSIISWWILFVKKWFLWRKVCAFFSLFFIRRNIHLRRSGGGAARRDCQQQQLRYVLYYVCTKQNNRQMAFRAINHAALGKEYSGTNKQTDRKSSKSPVAAFAVVENGTCSAPRPRLRPKWDTITHTCPDEFLLVNGRKFESVIGGDGAGGR